MRSAFRYFYAGLSWLFLAAVIAQVFFAGFMLFGVGGGRALHEGVGWSIHTANFLWLAVPALAGAGRTAILLGLGLFAVVFVQPLLPGIQDSAPVVAALHPVNALLIFWLSLELARRSLATLRAERIPQPAT